MQLTSKERIMRIFRKEEVDRPVLKLWGTPFPDEPHSHPSYRQVTDLAFQLSDVFISASTPFDFCAGMYQSEVVEQYLTDTADPTWKDQHTIWHTPKGDLHMLTRISILGEPPYIVEHPVKEPEDLEALLSLPYKPYPVDVREYEHSVAKLGDRGVVMMQVDHAGYALQRMIGSETLAYFSIDCRELLSEAIHLFGQRMYDHINDIFDSGIQAPIGWCGPEVFIPPLMSPRDFHDFVYKVDKPICDLIHDRGSHVWVHCHGKVKQFLDPFIEMGVDILNPLEPPKNGDIDLHSVAKNYGNLIGLEGNIEIQDVLQASPEQLKALIDDCVEAGQKSGRFILCASGGYLEYPFPDQHFIDNLLLYLRYGYEVVERYRC